jgi:FixJ family two-component response regulator
MYKLIIVDDEEDIVRTLVLLFKMRKIPVSFVAYDGPKAIEKFKAADPKPGIMIIDYRLPSMTGMDVMREVLKTTPNVNVIILSADDSIEHESLQAGASMFMKKPVRNKEMTEAIQSLTNI